jgi:hypothetical protein
VLRIVPSNHRSRLDGPLFRLGMSNCEITLSKVAEICLLENRVYRVAALWNGCVVYQFQKSVRRQRIKEHNIIAWESSYRGMRLIVLFWFIDNADIGTSCAADPFYCPYIADSKSAFSANLQCAAKSLH